MRSIITATLVLMPLVACAPVVSEESLVVNPLCLVTWPQGRDILCHGAKWNSVTNECSFYTFDDGTPCWNGTGECHSGRCIEPGPNCEPGEHTPISTTVCSDDSDCFTGNPCVFRDCPEPEMTICHGTPAQDGISCGPGKVCFKGSCCAMPDSPN